MSLSKGMLRQAQRALRAQRALAQDPQSYGLRQALQLVDQVGCQTAACHIGDHVAQLTTGRQHLALDVDMGVGQQTVDRCKHAGDVLVDV